MKYIHSFLIWVMMGFLTFCLFMAVFILEIFYFPFDKQRKVAHTQSYWWSDCLIAMNPFWKLTVRGLENIDRSKTYVIVANHQSLADIVVLYKIRMQFKWIAKDSLYMVPCIGWVLALVKHIKLVRGEYGSIKKVYRQAAEWLRKDMSVLIFPEGTRSLTNQMNVFQTGAFKLAIK